ncbi:phage tail protein, partial [Escherichia coli]|uniref:phage tail protein n=2 Tax=Escherichia coli TaxID=562 RepID=UPI0005096F02
MTTKHCSILTNRGKALEAASAARGAPVVLDGFVVGDGNGNAVTPEAGQTALVREVYRGTISRLTVSPDQENQFIAYLVLPEGAGGFTVREAGLLTTDGVLYAVGSCAAIEKPENGVTATLQFRLAVAESAQVMLNVATGDGLFLRQDRNLSDVEDKDEAVENLGLKPTMDKAKNAVQRDGDTMTGELKIRGVNALRIFNEAFGLIFRRSEEFLHLIPTSEGQGENGDIGPLR